MNTHTDPMTRQSTKTVAAEVVFIEDPRGGRWTAQLLTTEGVTGTVLGRPVSRLPLLTIREVQVPAPQGFPGRPRLEYQWKTPGATAHNGNRHHFAYSLNEAQERVQAWASRRFRVEVER